MEAFEYFESNREYYSSGGGGDGGTRWADVTIISPTNNDRKIFFEKFAIGVS